MRKVNWVGMGVCDINEDFIDEYRVFARAYKGADFYWEIDKFVPLTEEEKTGRYAVLARYKGEEGYTKCVASGYVSTSIEDAKKACEEFFYLLTGQEV
jgi:hypothetical protein